MFDQKGTQGEQPRSFVDKIEDLKRVEVYTWLVRNPSDHCLKRHTEQNRLILVFISFSFFSGYRNR